MDYKFDGYQVEKNIAIRVIEDGFNRTLANGHRRSELFDENNNTQYFVEWSFIGSSTIQIIEYSSVELAA